MIFNMILAGEVKKTPEYDEYTLLMCHCENFTDSSIHARTLTSLGVTISTAQKKFGNASFYFNGSSRVLVGSNFAFGTGDFTVEMWVYPESISNDNFFFSGEASGELFFGRQSGNGRLGIGRGGVAWDSTASASLSLNTWNHVAVVRNGTTVYFFVNGALKGTATNSNSYNIAAGSAQLGAQGTTYNYYFKGYMDEIRVSNMARWTANFTPPTESYGQ